jgi:hypothetical protein
MADGRREESQERQMAEGKKKRKEKKLMTNDK